MQIYNNILECIGNTPIVSLKEFSPNLYAKCEYFNPSHSIKDRAAFEMISQALKEKKINQDSTIIEASSGNTGIALAMICASLKLKLVIAMPESMSIERRKMMSFFGAKLELTPASKGMQGALDRANELLEEIPNSFIISQFENINNKNAHRNKTALEILDIMPDVDIFVAGFGTGGTISGVGEILKEKNPNVKIIAIEPKSSPLLSQKIASSHKIQGIGANFIPKILNQDIIDEILCVSNEDAINTALELGKIGIMAGISSGANVFIASQIAKQNQDKKVLTMLNDTAERYLSTDLFLNL
ncbi:cysteine synthase A [Campylobacter volucris]|uniref:Cysteine synthase n=1 Tax=Campylobacter volucris TaxID=1031542 RepID=A0AAE5YIS4_9BACT|nr:cysteine synthase A [Campylobacter volucris]AJC94503.1 cysteine synthase [Campylobacter volucris LMG 24379]KAB0578053.1 cysteine synthase A [Campylobacter volucris]MBF7045766.1 cysteine synthase A [Campylobacter volucris]MBF7068544.1 cysteine synthase A [Campylobacter volucris]QBL13144.1 cysteine synthase A [Campylobacter volucris]